MDWKHWLGIAGVAQHENARAQRLAGYFEICSVMVALWIIIVWYQETKNLLSAQDVHLYDVSIWLFFLVETMVMTAVVDHKTYYLRYNWLNVLIVLAGIPIVLGLIHSYSFTIGALRLLLVFNLFIGLSSTTRKVLSRGRLGATLMVTLVFTLLAGLMIHALDPNVRTAGDGMWWAWVTLTSVGYGDVVPTSAAGRFLAIVVMVVGMGFSALLTANILALFISEQEGKIARTTQRELEEQLKMEKRLDEIEKKIDRLLQKDDPQP